MTEIKYDPALCEKCETVDCLMKCRYIDLGLDQARKERREIMAGEYSRVLDECITCYACEEYCPFDNHPFYLIVERQEQLKRWPVPRPLVKQQLGMMAMRGRIEPKRVSKPVIDMCFFPMLTGTVRGRLFEGATHFVGSDIFCNIMWLHFGKNSVIRERLPKVIDNIMEYALRDSGVDEIVCYHDECYGTYTRLAPAYGIEVPFKTVHLFEYLARRLTELKSEIRPLNQVAAYQRPCSNRLIPETQHWVDEIFELIGVERPQREYDRETALCCAMTVKAAQRDELADELQKKNLDDMEAAGARYCVFNCPACFMEMNKMVAARGMVPILMADLCHMALGEGLGW